MSKDKDGYSLPDWRDIVFMRNIIPLDGYGFAPVLTILVPPDTTNKKGEKKMELKDKVTEVVEDFCDKLQSFTSLDVSNKVKQQGFASTRHRDIAHVVRILYVEGLMEDFGFERSMIDVTVSSGNTRQAYLYHHQSVSASAYDRRSQVAIPPAQSDQDAKNDDSQDTQSDSQSATPMVIPSSARTAGTVQVVNSSNDRQVRRQKGDCRLEIPATWVRHLGWAEESTIYAVHENDIVLKNSHQVDVSDTVLATATIVDGRLRVPKTAFVKAGFQSGSGLNHEVVLGNDHIIVKDA